ncbi:MAG: hypothetical protein QXO32_07270 [Candidatus Bathyarchaeia archaeon]
MKAYPFTRIAKVHDRNRFITVEWTFYELFIGRFDTDLKGEKYSILKFGGTSVNSEDKLEMAYRSIAREVEHGFKTVAVVSAFRGVTDLLFQLTQKPKVNGEFYSEWRRLHIGCERHLPEGYDESLLGKVKARAGFIAKSYDTPWAVDELLSMGESYSAHILHGYLLGKGLKVGLMDFDDPDFPTLGDGEFGSARIDLELTRMACEKALKARFRNLGCVIVPGMGCVSPLDGRVRVRRGASDYVATALSYGLKARRLWILSDVNGIKAADSSIIKEAETVPYLTVGELLDAGALGAKNTNTRFFLPLTKHCPLETYFAKHDEMDGEKTRIVREELNSKSSAPVKLVAGREVLVYTFRGYDIEKYVLDVEQSLSEKYDFIRGGGFKRERFFAFFDLSQAPRIQRSIMEVKGDVEVSPSKMAIVGIVGEGMKRTKKVIERLGKALGDINIVYTLDISRISAGVVLNKEDLKEAVERLYASFIKA